MSAQSRQHSMDSSSAISSSLSSSRSTVTTGMLNTLQQWNETTFSSYCHQMTKAIEKDTTRRKSADREITIDLRSSSADALTLFGETLSWSLVAHDIDADRTTLDDVKVFYEKLNDQYNQDDLAIRGHSPALRKCDFFVTKVIPELYNAYNDDLSRVEECIAVTFSTFRTNQRLNDQDKSLKRYGHKLRITLMNMFNIRQFEQNVPEHDQQRVIYQYVKQFQLTYPRYKGSSGGWTIPRNVREKGSIEMYNSSFEWLTNPVLRAQVYRMSTETLQQLRSVYKEHYQVPYRECREIYPRSIQDIITSQVFKYNPEEDFAFIVMPYRPLYEAVEVNQAIEKAVLAGFDAILTRLEKCENPKEYNEYLQEKIVIENDNEIYPIPSRIDQFYHLLDQGFYIEQYGGTTDYERYYTTKHVQEMYLNILKQVSGIIHDLPEFIEINDISKEEYQKKLNDIQLTAMAQDKTIRDTLAKFRQQYKEIMDPEPENQLPSDAYKRVYTLLKLVEFYVQEQAFYQIKTQIQGVTRPSTGSLSAIVGTQAWKVALREEIILQRQKIHTIVAVNNKAGKVVYCHSPDDKHSPLFVAIEKRNQELYNEYKESVDMCKGACDKYHELLVDLKEGLERILIKGEKELDLSLTQDVIPITPLNTIEGRWCIPLSWIAPSLISKNTMSSNNFCRVSGKEEPKMESLCYAILQHLDVHALSYDDPWKWKDVLHMLCFIEWERMKTEKPPVQSSPRSISVSPNRTMSDKHNHASH